jgi:hypothetical protein
MLAAREPLLLGRRDHFPVDDRAAAWSWNTALMPGTRTAHLPNVRSSGP